MIKHISVKKFPLYEVFLRLRKAWVVDDKDFWFFLFFSLIIVFYIIDEGHWLKPKSLSLGRYLPEGLAAEAFTEIFLLIVIAMVRKFYDSFNTSRLSIERVEVILIYLT